MIIFRVLVNHFQITPGPMTLLVVTVTLTFILKLGLNFDATEPFVF